MWALLTQPENIYFAVALAIMVMLGLLEIINLFVGGVSDWMDQLLPESLTEPSTPELHIDAASAGVWVQFLAWLYIGRVPILMWLVVFLATYGMSGFVLQKIYFAIFTAYLPASLAGAAVFFLVLPIVRYVSMGLYKVLPKDFSTAVHSDSLIGREAQIVLGEARQGYPAQAKLKDEFGQTHYVMVEPDAEQYFPQGSIILLVARESTTYKAILQTQQIPVE